MAICAELQIKKDILQSYLDYMYYERNYSLHTIRAYKQDINSFLNYLEQRQLRLAEVDTKVLRHYFGLQRQGVGSLSKSHAASKGITARTQARKLSVIRSFCYFLEKKCYIEADAPIQKALNLIQAPRFQNPLPKMPSLDELERIFSQVAKPNRSHSVNISMQKQSLHLRDLAICEMLYSTGLRISELLSLQVSSFQNKAKYQASPELKILGKRRKERFVFLGSQAQLALQAYLSHRKHLVRTIASNALFLNARGGPLTDRGARFILETMRKRLGLAKALSPHLFRHAFASDLLNAGADIRSIQELLGHSSLDTTQIYTHISKEKLQEDYRRCHPHAR